MNIYTFSTLDGPLYFPPFDSVLLIQKGALELHVDQGNKQGEVFRNHTIPWLRILKEM